MENIKRKMIMNFKSAFVLPAAIFVMATIAINCSTRRSLPLAGPLELTALEKSGEKVFMEHCQRCHPHGEAGLGPAINPAPAFGKRFQIRHGLGAMPAFDEALISDKELDQVVSYLKAVRKNE